MSEPFDHSPQLGVGVAKMSPDIEQTFEKRLHVSSPIFREVLAHRGEVTIALENDASVYRREEVVVLQRAGVLRPHRVHADECEAVLATFLEPRDLPQGPAPLDTLPRCSALSVGLVVGQFRSRASLVAENELSPTATGGCEESAAAQASDVHRLAALDDRAADEVDGFRGGDGDAGAAGHCASVAPGGLPPSVAMAVTSSRPKADTPRDADSARWRRETKGGALSGFG